MKIGEAGLALIKEFEGCKLIAYQDSVGIWTIGYGSTRDVHKGMIIDATEAEIRLLRDLEVAEKCVTNSVTVPITSNQADALISFTFNLGCGNLRKSTLLRRLNDGDDEGAANEFTKWDMAGGKVLPGLTRRRLAEQALFRRA